MELVVMPPIDPANNSIHMCVLQIFQATTAKDHIIIRRAFLPSLLNCNKTSLHYREASFITWSQYHQCVEANQSPVNRQALSMPQTSVLFASPSLLSPQVLSLAKHIPRRLLLILEASWTYVQHPAAAIHHRMIEQSQSSLPNKTQTSTKQYPSKSLQKYHNATNLLCAVAESLLPSCMEPQHGAKTISPNSRALVFTAFRFHKHTSAPECHVCK